MLSNNHVLADENRYKKGGPIVQPGPLDGGKPGTDGVAKLTAFVKLVTSGANLVDCAIAAVNKGVPVNPRTLKGIGALAGVRSGGLGIGDTVHKVGRTTGVRHGRVTAVELDGVSVEYDIGVISFDNQVEIEGSGARSFSDAGDSGSLIVDQQLMAAALLFAGGDHGGPQRQGPDVRQSHSVSLLGAQGETRVEAHWLSRSIRRARRRMPRGPRWRTSRASSASG
jgi:hypothetical protein